MKALCSDEEFVEIVESSDTMVQAAARIGYSDVRKAYERRRRLENKFGRSIHTLNPKATVWQSQPVPERYLSTLEDGVVVVFSDAHYWPGEPSTAHRALLRFIELYKPKIVVNNGDSLDGAKISRHPPFGWSNLPTVKEEIDVNKERLAEIEERTDAELIWTKGNHCARFEARLAAHCPEYANVEGFDLGSHFPKWQFAMSLWINDQAVIKHRYKGGIHATHNNTIWSGKTMVTGHLHSLKVTPFTDYNGTRWGVDTGTLADPFSPQFEYAEDSPRNWRSGFAVLTFRDGELLDPELVRVRAPGEVVFRGKVYEV